MDKSCKVYLIPQNVNYSFTGTDISHKIKPNCKGTATQGGNEWKVKKIILKLKLKLILVLLYLVLH